MFSRCPATRYEIHAMHLLSRPYSGCPLIRSRQQLVQRVQRAEVEAEPRHRRRRRRRKRETPPAGSIVHPVTRLRSADDLAARPPALRQRSASAAARAARVDSVDKAEAEAG